MQFLSNVYICTPNYWNLFSNNAGVVELVDTLDLGSSAARCESSSLSACTRLKASQLEKLFLFILVYLLQDFESHLKVVKSIIEWILV